MKQSSDIIRFCLLPSVGLLLSACSGGGGQVSSDEVNDAIEAQNKGDKSKAEALMNRAAAKTGMSSAVLRDQILPGLGVKP